MIYQSQYIRQHTLFFNISVNIYISVSIHYSSTQSSTGCSNTGSLDFSIRRQLHRFSLQRSHTNASAPKYRWLSKHKMFNVKLTSYCQNTSLRWSHFSQSQGSSQQYIAVSKAYILNAYTQLQYRFKLTQQSPLYATF